MMTEARPTDSKWPASNHAGRHICGAVIAIVWSALIGCGYPAGGSKGFAGSAHTWVSTEHQPITLSLYDTRTNEQIWTMDVPAGKKLVTKFVPEGGDDPVLRPDRLEYDIMPIDQRTGSLMSMLSVPPPTARRFELTVRDEMEYAPRPEDAMVEESVQRNRPDWWTPEGGPMPDDYDNRDW